jgi:preprotein translocase subunit YajC
MFAVLYFLMIRPQQKKMKDHETLMTSLQKVEEVITQAGIFGKIHGIADKFITLEVDNNVKIKKRLFMTATPKVSLKDDDEIVSMKDKHIYGKQIFRVFIYIRFIDESLG